MCYHHAWLQLVHSNSLIVTSIMMKLLMVILIINIFWKRNLCLLHMPTRGQPEILHVCGKAM